MFDLTSGEIELLCIRWIEGKRVGTPIAPIGIADPVCQRGPGIVGIEFVYPAYVCTRIGNPLLFCAVRSGQPG